MSWTSKKNNHISQAIAKAEYVMAAVNCLNIMWIKKLLKGMKEEITNPMLINCDNTSAINIFKTSSDAH